MELLAYFNVSGNLSEPLMIMEDDKTKTMLKRSKNKTNKVRVTTAESQLEFEMQKGSLGQDLFDQVVRTIGLREVWYFGIQYIDKDGNPTFLRLDKKISSNDFAPGSEYDFKFMVKFYPENVEEELIQTCTITHFYLQVKSDIMSGKIYCPTDTAVLLASYACVAKYGPYDPQSCPKSLPIDRLITGKEQYDQTDEQWYERIIAYYKDHHDMSREDAMVQYLQIAQDLEMYGVETFNIKNKKGTSLVLGVDALGLSIYEPGNLLDPKIGFPWSEIRNLSFHDKKFIIKPADKSAKEFFFLVEKSKINKRILALCTGNHELYMRRRKSDSIEVQQMKIQAKEERELKEAERQRLKEERLQRMENEQKLRELRAQMVEKESDLADMKNKASAYESKIAELEMLLQQERHARESLQKSQDKLAEMNRKLKEETAASAEERNRLMAQRDEVQREVEAQKVAMAKKEAEKAQAEAELRRMREKHDAKHKSQVNGSGDAASQDDESEAKELEVIPNVRRTEESRVTAVSKNETLQTKLANLKMELSSTRDQSKMRDIDRRHEYNVREGNDKYKTLRNIRKGNTMCRVEQFESM
ncbi:Moesin/ezrin/radixin [Echinococcus granulosus]|uniref:Moesin/ezrin/radixin n=3 Tax=Echinococcus granulosus TaxID=6210 RepID=W6UQS2_ECHGR|nr:Moesin/ezrin/radixin [Echinococcus granulosus]EUB64035.1 Moesin/ezrin/radixin [Echinococcus granulosus]